MVQHTIVAFLKYNCITLDADEVTTTKSIADVEYDYDEEDYEDTTSGRSVPSGPFGQLFVRVMDFKARIKSELNLIGRNIRLALAFLFVS